MMIRRLAFVLLSLSLVSCARFGAVTEVSANGTWTRESRFITSEDSSDKPGSLEFSIRQELSDYFVIPEDDGWQRGASNELGEGVLTLRRSANEGEKLSELTVLSKAGEPWVRNEVTVRRLSDERLEYRETLRWVGPRIDAVKEASKKFVEALVEQLPDDIEKREVVATVLAKSLRQNYVRLLFGGSNQQPLMSQAMVHREVAVRRLSTRLRMAALADLQAQLGDHPQAKRWPEVTAHIAKFATLEKLGKDDDGENDLLDDDRLLIPLSFTAKLPGRIIETNGEVDPVSGEIYWTLFAGSAAFEDVVIRAVCEVN